MGRKRRRWTDLLRIVWVIRLLTTLGRDIDIVIRQPRSATGGKLRIAASEID